MCDMNDVKMTEHHAENEKALAETFYIDFVK